MRTDVGRLIVVTGVMASGKSTVAQALAERFDPSVHVRGDVFRRFVVNGALEPVPPVTEDMLRQLRLRYLAGTRAAQTYAEAGFTAVLQDVMIGPILGEVVGMISFSPAHVVVLDPGPEAVAAREQARPKTGYSEGWTPADMVAGHREGTPRLGLWLDTSTDTAEQTVGAIVARLDEASIVPLTRG